jgi:hypothetical protein
MLSEGANLIGSIAQAVVRLRFDSEWDVAGGLGAAGDVEVRHRSGGEQVSISVFVWYEETGTMHEPAD